MLEKLTKREKVLIYLMVLLLIFAGGFIYLVKPAAERASAASDRLAEAKYQAETMEMNLASKDSYRLQLDQLNSDIEAIKDELPEAMSNPAIDQMVTGLVKAAGMSPVSLEILDGVVQQNDYQSDEVIEDTAIDEGQVQEATLGGVKVSTVQVACSGNVAQFKAFLDKAAEEKGVAVTGFALAGTSTTQTILSNTIGTGYSYSSITSAGGGYNAEITMVIYQRAE